ncbi:hypothetical protein PCH_Pc18g04360 [Penicillium rubens Wisconsin 54-1255]|uniref:Uncharacterized protein n=1 Tax=Penicillium rubens (strain ATCC 28089 / DSM 1075 / NRRL 1951 / Wisconsin 54-1255) TaxID=500485 RepID=B6HBK4_PENRW|nr:hypothetical protein PCH_Pc18g04360 [Penicillium rubens Wisconsin 54-1255]
MGFHISVLIFAGSSGPHQWFFSLGSFCYGQTSVYFWLISGRRDPDAVTTPWGIPSSRFGAVFDISSPLMRLLDKASFEQGNHFALFGFFGTRRSAESLRSLFAMRKAALQRATADPAYHGLRSKYRVYSHRYLPLRYTACVSTRLPCDAVELDLASDSVTKPSNSR